MKKTIYVFVRNDLSYAQKVVQAAHAVLEATRAFLADTDRYKIVIFAIRNEIKLKAVADEATSNGIRSVAFTEPDMNFEVTAIACEPVTDEKKHVFARYKLLSE